MKQLLSIAGILCFILQWGNAQSNPSARTLSAFNYDLTTAVDPYVDLTGAISINNGEIWDQPEYIVPMAFPFEMNGHAIASFQFNGSGSIMASNTTVPFVVAELFPFEADLIDRGALGSTSLSPISYTVEGIPGSQVQKIEFKNAGSKYEMELLGTLNMYVNFQCWLFEGSNTIEFHFGPSSISNTIVFYGGTNGPKSGLTDYDEYEHLYSHGHFLIGPASNPVLFQDPEYVIGTPVTGTVYRFTYLPPLSITVTGVNGTSFCQPNGSAQVVATGGILPFSYLWSTGATTPSIDNLDAGIYYITVEDADGSTVTDSVTIYNAAPMSINITSTDETAVGANDGTAIAFPSGGTSPYLYNWSNGATTSIITALAPGLYDVTVTDASGCTAEQSIIINAYVCPNLTLEVSVINATCHGICNGSVTVLQVLQGTAPYSFSWNVGSTAQSIDNLCAADYAVTVIDANGCTISGSYQVTQPTELIVNAGATNESMQNLHDGTAWAAHTGGTLPYTYTWSNGSTDSLIVNLSAGEYFVTVTDANGCESNDSITVNACFMLFEQFRWNITCADSCNGDLILGETGGMGPFMCVWSTGDTTSSLAISNLCAGNYNVTVTDLGQNCSNTLSALFTQPQPLVGVVDTVIHLTDSTVTAIYISITGGTQPYIPIWTGPHGQIFVVDTSVTNVEPGFYHVHIVDAQGCQTDIDSIEVLDQTTGLSPIPKWKLDIYPNPANDIINVKGVGANEYQFQLLAVDGQVIKVWKNTSTLDVHDIVPGLYMLRCLSGQYSLVKPVFILH